jgi:hypothetical protein
MELVVLSALVLALLLPALRISGTVAWPWSLALAPLSLAGAVFLVALAFTHLRRYFSPLQRLVNASHDAASTTPPPERLEPPLAAEAAGERILSQHPELLAALCLGFRMKRLQPVVLGKSVVDAWGVYQAALIASSLELEQVKMLARQHTELYRASGRRAVGKRPPDAILMKKAVEHFGRCAERTSRRGGSTDCPFEHVVVVFGTRTPARDATLKSIAPRVRALLEHQYPQLATASLGDGTAVKYSEWQKQATDDRRELERARKEQQRLQSRLEESAAELKGARQQTEALRADIERARDEARESARAGQEKIVADLRSSLERNQMEHARQLQRLELEQEKMAAASAALTEERDTLERALFDASDEDGEAGTVEGSTLAGVRILVVGGDARMVGPIREFVEKHGVQMLHDDSVNAALLVGGVDVVVFWIRYLSHPKYFGVRRECRVQGATHCYWTRTSPASLLALVAEARRISVAKAAQRELPGSQGSVT